MLLLALGALGCAPKDNRLRLVGEDPRLDPLSWLSGSWAGLAEGARVEEHWSVPAGGTMLGMNRTVAGGRTVFYEYLRIEATDDGIVYLASPLGRHPPTAFALVGMGEREVVFENPEHDFPQRVAYWREADTLHARVEGFEDSERRSSQFSMVRATISTLEE